MVKFVIVPPVLKHIYQFGPFRLDMGQHLLTREGETLPLTHKAFDTLAFLVQNSGRILQKEEMMNSIWSDSFVEEATLAQNIFTLRKVLGETPLEVRYIETVPKLGYRFIAEVEELLPENSEQMTNQESRNLTARSLAVLPFQTLTNDSGDEYFGLGMADALITRLSNIREISVRPSSAIIKYHRQNIDLYTAGRELKVQLILDGIIQRLDDRIRVTVQLVNTESAVPLWADKFDEKFSDVFTIQDIISEKVVEALTLKLTSAQKLLLTKRYTRDSDVYRYYLKGRYLWSKWTEEGFKKSIDFFECAIKIEPDYALPYAGLADTYVSLCFYGHMPSYQGMLKVKAMARKALQLDDQLAEAHLPLAAALFFYDWDWAGAEEEFKRSIKTNPSYAVAHQSYGLYLTAMKRFSEALSSFKQALEADPVSPLIKTSAALPYYYSGNYKQAMEQFRETIEIDPYFGLAHVALADVYIQMEMYEQAIEHYKLGMATWGEKPVLPYLGYAYGLSNQRDEAMDILRRLERLSTKEYVSPFSMAVVCAGLKTDSEVFAWLEKAYQERSNRLVFLGVLPVFNDLRSDRRFISLLSRIGLEP
jgi:TolB-like protein/DNA-binding SARP family transcriptional activator